MFDVVERAARVFAGRWPNDGRVLLKEGARNLRGDWYGSNGDGRLYTLDMAPSDVEVAATSGPLILGALDGDKYVAERAAPVRKVRRQYGNLQQYVTSTDLTKLARSLGGAAGGQPVRANPKVTSTAYKCLEWALDASVPNEIIANADQDLGAALGAYVLDTWKLAREYEVAQLLTTAGNWAAANQIVGSSWSGSGKPIDDVFKGLQASHNPRPNLLIMSEQVGRYWYSNTTVQAYYMTKAREELHIEVVTVGAKVTSAASTGGQVDVWAVNGNNAVLVRTDPPAEALKGVAGPPPGAESITTAATARWKGDEIRSVPKGEIWVMVEDVLLRTFWEPRIGARGLQGCVLAVNESPVMLDGTIGAIITGVA